MTTMTTIFDTTITTKPAALPQHLVYFVIDTSQSMVFEASLLLPCVRRFEQELCDGERTRVRYVLAHHDGAVLIRDGKELPEHFRPFGPPNLAAALRTTMRALMDEEHEEGELLSPDHVRSVVLITDGMESHLLRDSLMYQELAPELHTTMYDFQQWQRDAYAPRIRFLVLGIDLYFPHRLIRDLVQPLFEPNADPGAAWFMMYARRTMTPDLTTFTPGCAPLSYPACARLQYEATLEPMMHMVFDGEGVPMEELGIKTEGGAADGTTSTTKMPAPTCREVIIRASELYNATITRLRTLTDKDLCQEEADRLLAALSAEVLHSRPPPPRLACTYVTDLLRAVGRLKSELDVMDTSFMGLSQVFQGDVMAFANRSRFNKSRLHAIQRGALVDYRSAMMQLVHILWSQRRLRQEKAEANKETKAADVTEEFDICALTLENEHEKHEKLVSLLLGGPEGGDDDPRTLPDLYTRAIQALPTLKHMIDGDYFLAYAVAVDPEHLCQLSYNPFKLRFKRLSPSLTHVGINSASRETAVNAVVRDMRNRQGKQPPAGPEARRYAALVEGRKRDDPLSHPHIIYVLKPVYNPELFGSDMFLAVASACLTPSKERALGDLTAQQVQLPDAPLAIVAALLHYYLKDGLFPTNVLPRLLRLVADTFGPSGPAFRPGWSTYVNKLASKDFEEALIPGSGERFELRTHDIGHALLAILVSLETRAAEWDGDMLYERTCGLLAFFFRSMRTGRESALYLQSLDTGRAPYALRPSDDLPTTTTTTAPRAMMHHPAALRETQPICGLLDRLSAKVFKEAADARAAVGAMHAALRAPSTAYPKLTEYEAFLHIQLTGTRPPSHLEHLVCPCTGIAPYQKEGWTPDMIVRIMTLVAERYHMPLPRIPNPIHTLFAVLHLERDNSSQNTSPRWGVKLPRNPTTGRIPQRDPNDTLDESDRSLYVELHRAPANARAAEWTRMTYRKHSVAKQP